VKLNVAAHEVIANSVLISSMLYFLAIWEGTKVGVAHITSKIRNFFWLGSLTRTRAKVAWKVYYLQRKAGGLNMIDPQEALTMLMAKWALSVLEPGQSNFKALM
jgi:hypothetical protein